MSVRLSVLVLAPLFAAATAHAQAPGEVAPGVAPPPVADPCGGGVVAVMANRWAVGVSLGAFSVAPKDASGDQTTDFRTSELSIRYRATPHFEIELLLNGGRQVLKDNTDGNLAMGGGTLGARYRFRPEQPWNWWLMGGLGATVIERQDSTKEERDAATRPHMAFGIGMERRFRRFALQAEARGLALGPRKDASNTNVTPPMPPKQPVPDGTMPMPPPVPTAAQGDELSGGTFTIGAAFYF
jgi:hypothetical protein